MDLPLHCIVHDDEVYFRGVDITAMMGEAYRRHPEAIPAFEEMSDAMLMGRTFAGVRPDDTFEA